MIAVAAFAMAAGRSAARADVRLNVGDNFQAVISKNPAGTQYRIASGTHRLQSVTPKNGDSYFGEVGAVMKGSKLLDPAAALPSGPLYCWSGQTNLPVSYRAYGEPALAGSERAVYYLCELFVNGVRYRHMNSLDLVTGPGQWYYDGTDKVYLYGNPSGKTVELSLTRGAFALEKTSNVTIENLSIQQYATDIRPNGAITAGTSTTLRNLDVSYCHATSLKIGPFGVLENCRMTRNGQIGFIGGGANAPITVRNNEVGKNHEIGTECGEDGALKIAMSFDGMFEQNWIYDNPGINLWFDAFNAANTIRSNWVVSSNAVKPDCVRAIMYEISGTVALAPTLICWNRVDNSSDIGVYVSHSQHVFVFENAISTNSTGNVRAVDNGTRLPGIAKLRVWGNDCSASSTRMQVSISGTSAEHTAGMIEFIDGNNYRGCNRFLLSFTGTGMSFADWKSKTGYDVHGSWTSTQGSPSLPSWGIPFAPSHYGLLPSGLTAYFRLDETSGTTVFNTAVNGLNGTLSGGPAFAAGINKGALSFAQSGTAQQYASLGTTPGSTDALTVAFWMKPGRTSDDMIPVGKLPSGTGGRGWAFKLRNNGDLFFRVGSEGNASDLSVGANTYGTNWMHVAATFANGTARLYLNGSLRATRTNIPQTTADAATDLRLGVPAAGAIERYVGLLDDVQIYSAALTAAQVKSLVHGLETPPVGYWAFDDGAGTFARDFSPNGINISTGTATTAPGPGHGTLVNAPAWVAGQRGYALRFTGSESVAVPSSAGLSVSGTAFTAMAWINPASVSGTQALIAKGSDWSVRLRDGRPRAEFTLSDGSAMAAETAAAEVTAGKFAHLAVVRNGASVAIYVDGTAKTVTPVTPLQALPLRTSGDGLTIGRAPDLGFNGAMDEVRLYDAALSAGEVRLLKEHAQPAVFQSAMVLAGASPEVGGTVAGGMVYTLGDTAALKAAANPGYTFSHWEEGGVSVGTSPSYTFTVSAQRLLVARFDQLPSEAWRLANFTAAELADPETGGPDGQPEGDGIGNYLKYAFNLDRKVPDRQALPKIDLESGYPRITYVQNKAATDLAFTVEVSGDLKTWDSGPQYTALPVLLEDNGSTRTFQVSGLLPVGEGNQFLRLKVTGP